MHRKQYIQPRKKAEQHTSHKYQPKPDFNIKKFKQKLSSTSKIQSAISLPEVDSQVVTESLAITLKFLLNTLQAAIPDKRHAKLNLFLFCLFAYQMSMVMAATECHANDLHGPFDKACKVLGVSLDYLTNYYYTYAQTTPTCRYDIVCTSGQDKELYFKLMKPYVSIDGIDLHYDGSKLTERVIQQDIFQKPDPNKFYEYHTYPSPKPGN